MLKQSLIAALVLSAGATTSAFADTKLRGVDIKPVTGQFAANPRIVVERKGGKLVISDNPIAFSIRVGGRMENTSKKYTIFQADIIVQNIWGKGATYDLLPRGLGNGEGVRKIDGTKPMYFYKSYLGPVADQALTVCADHRKAETGVYTVDLPLSLYVGAGKEYFGGHEDIVRKEAHMQIKADVFCPPAPQRTEVPETKPERMKIPPKVKSAKLAIVNGIGKSCPQKIFLVATFETDRAGAFDVILRRQDGETDRKTVTAVKKGGKFVAKLERTYEFNKNVRRKYMVEVVGQAKASAWEAMTLNCGGLGQAGEKGGLKLK